MPKLNESVTKQVSVKCTRKSYTNKETNQTSEYNQYALIINGIPIVVRPSVQDNTGRFLLEEFFDK